MRTLTGCVFQRGAPGDGGRAGGCAAAAEGALLRGRRRRAGHRCLVHRLLERNPDAGTNQTFTLMPVGQR